MVPFMAGAFGVMVSSGVGDDGVTGKAAFEGAANVAAETLSVMRTVASFGGEGSAARRFEGKLVLAERAAIKQSVKQGAGQGLTWLSFFGMMGLAFWYAGVLVVSGTEDAMRLHPLPANFSGPYNPTLNETFELSHALALELCPPLPLLFSCALVSTKFARVSKTLHSPNVRAYIITRPMYARILSEKKRSIIKTVGDQLSEQASSATSGALGRGSCTLTRARRSRCARAASGGTP